MAGVVGVPGTHRRGCVTVDEAGGDRFAVAGCCLVHPSTHPL